MIGSIGQVEARKERIPMPINVAKGGGIVYSRMVV
jgi:hypothetical protein